MATYMEIAKKCSSIWILTFIVVAQVSGNDDNHQKSIFQDLYNLVTTSSNPLVIPKNAFPINVGVQSGIVAIHSVDREANLIDVTRWGSATWQTDFTWDPADYNGIKNMSVPYHSIWLPDLHVYNANSAFNFIREPSAVVFSSGMHAVFSHVRSKIHCGFSLAHDLCTIRIAPWGSDNSKIRINEHSDNPYDMNAILADENVKLTQYEVTSYSYRKSTMRIANMPAFLDVMDFSFTFRESKKASRYPGPFKALFSWS